MRRRPPAPTRARARGGGLLAAMTERELQDTIVEAAKATGLWLPAYHPFDARRSAAGWPDVVLVGHPDKAMAGWALFLELKDEHRKVTPEQELYLAGLKAVAADRRIIVELVRPRDLDRILRLLGRRRRHAARRRPPLRLGLPTPDTPTLADPPTGA